MIIKFFSANQAWFQVLNITENSFLRHKKISCGYETNEYGVLKIQRSIFNNEKDANENDKSNEVKQIFTPYTAPLHVLLKL